MVKENHVTLKPSLYGLTVELSRTVQDNGKERVWITVRQDKRLPTKWNLYTSLSYPQGADIQFTRDTGIIPKWSKKRKT